MIGKRIGIVTGGGDCPGLNTVIRAVAKAAAQRGWETLGFLGGYEGLLEPRRFVNLDYNAISGLLLRGGTILGTANRGKFSAEDRPRRVARPADGAAGRDEERLRGDGPRRPGFDRRRRIAQHRAAAVRAWHADRRRAQDDRQRSGRDALHVRLRLRRRLRDRCARPPAHDGGEPQPRDGAGGDGPLRRLDRAVRRHCRRRGRDPDPGGPVSTTNPSARRCASASSRESTSR